MHRKRKVYIIYGCMLIETNCSTRYDVWVDPGLLTPCMVFCPLHLLEQKVMTETACVSWRWGGSPKQPLI